MIFLQNQIKLPCQNLVGDKYAYNQMYKNDKCKIDKNILKHTKYIDDKLKNITFGNKKNNYIKFSN